MFKYLNKTFFQAKDQVIFFHCKRLCVKTLVVQVNANIKVYRKVSTMVLKNF